MRITAWRVAAVPVAAAVVAMALAGSPSAAAIDPAPIGANAYFTGIVNGAGADAVIKTDCFGPVTPGEKGHPVGGQYVAVNPGLPSSAGVDVGFTGSLGNSVTVFLGLPTSSGSAASSLVGTVHDYVVHLAIPTTLSVPCGGPIDVGFVPGPTSPTAKTAVVHATLVSIGLTPGE